MESLRKRTRKVWSLGARVRALEEEIQECRQLNLRIAELCDVMMEMLLPIESRDTEAVAEVLERYRNGIGDPLKG